MPTMPPPDITFQASDLQRNYRTILNAAREGQARVRDQDGTTMLVVPESMVRTLRALASVSANLCLVASIVEKPGEGVAAPQELGEWTWLRVFDRKGLRAFARDMRQSLLVCARESTTELLEQRLQNWRGIADEISAQTERPKALTYAELVNQWAGAVDGTYRVSGPEDNEPFDDINHRKAIAALPAAEADDVSPTLVLGRL